MPDKTTHGAHYEALGLTNPHAETALLHAMRSDTSAAIEIAQEMTADEFCDPRHRIVFEAIQHLLLGIEAIDTPAIVAECRRIIREQKAKVAITDEYIESLNAGDTQRMTLYAKQVKRLAWLRGAADFAHWLVGALPERPDPDDLFAEAQERWQTLQPQTGHNRFVYGWETIDDYDKTLRERERQREEGTLLRFDWPWKSWNARIRPLQPGFVGIFAAADGQGKTTWLEQVAEHWAISGLQTVYVHLEDAYEYKMDRRMARQAQVSLNAVQDGDISDEQRWHIRQATERMEAWAGNLHYYDAAGQSMAEIIRELESKVSEGTCQAVVFDYLDKVQPTRSQVSLFGDNSWERQGYDMEQLKTFAERSRVPVFAATQGNKAMQSAGTQTRQNIQGSGQKSQKSQLVIILTRDIVGEDGLKSKDGVTLAEPGSYSPVAKIRIDKQNTGQLGEFQQFLIGQYFTVRDIVRKTGE